MDDYVTHPEYAEYVRRVDDWQKRQDARLSEAEGRIDEIIRLNANIERLAASMESMQKELTKQGTRLDSLEERDGDMWRTVVKYAITAVVAAVVGYAFAQIGM